MVRMASEAEPVDADERESLPEAERERLDALLERLIEAGADADEVQRAAADGRLPLLTIEQVLEGGPARLSANEIAERVGVPLEILETQWRALGMVVADPDERNRTEADLEAAKRVKALLDTGVSPRAVEEAARVMAMALAQVAASNRAMVTELVLAERDGAEEPGEAEVAPGGDLLAQIDAAERLEAVTRRLIPLVGPTLEHMYKLQLREQLRHAVVAVEGRRGAGPSGVDEAAVAFADLVGFTKLGEELPPEEFGEITQRFSGLAADAISGPVRLVKMIGDAAMFSSPDPAALVDTILELLELVAEQDDEFPGVRAGMSWGPVVARAGDFYGRPVNLASRLTGVARPGSLLVAADDVGPVKGAFKISDAGRRRLKGIDGAVHLYRVRDSDEDDGDGGQDGEEPVSPARRGSRRRRSRRSARPRP
jgi:adenylate cyclase